MSICSLPKPETASGVNVSDHALVRWLERSNLVNVAQLREQLAASLSSACVAADRINVNEFAVCRDGWKYIVRNHTLVTVFPVKDRVARNRRPRHHEEIL